MHLSPGDIYIKNDRGEITPWISEHAIVSYCEIKDANYFRQAARNRYNKGISTSFLEDFRKGKRQLLPDTGSSWRYGRVYGQYYYCFDNIPSKYQSKLGTRDQVLAIAEAPITKTANHLREQFSAHMRHQAEDYIDNSDIEYYMYQCGFNLALGMSADLASARGWMEMISHYEEGHIYKEHGIRFEQDFYELAVNAMPSVAFNNLSTPGSLRKKIHYYRQSEDKRQFMLSGKLGNDNRRVIGIYPIVSQETGEIFKFDIHEALIYELWMNPGQPGKKLKADVYEEYEEQILDYGLSPVSKRTVSFYLNRFSSRARMSLERDGRDHFNDNYKPYIVQHKLRYALTMWAGDFSGSKLYYRTKEDKWVNGKRQKGSVWKAKSWYLFRVFDVATGCVVGWSVCKSGEDFEQVSQGVRQAVEACGGRAACEFVTDHGPAFTRKENAEKLSLLFKKHRKIQVGNKQANPAEMYIHLQSQKARQFDNWMKSSFYSTHIDNQANPDYMDINNLPTESEALEQIGQLIEQWNNTPAKDGTVPADFTSNLENHNPQAPAVDHVKKRFIFGHETRTRLARSRGVLIVSNGKGQYREDYKFQIPHWEVAIDHIDQSLGGDPDLQVVVHWDESGADLYTPGGRFILSADPVKHAHKSEFESTPESFENLEEQTAIKKRFERVSKEYNEEVQEALSAAKVDEMTYNQRAALNNGKAKDEHNEIMQAVYQVNKDFRPPDEENEEFTGDVLDDI